MAMNSVMLAQLMKDMQDPEIMREAQKMMQDPAFQEHMKKMTQAPAFQAHMKNTQEMLKDPEKVKELENKMETALKEGNALLAKAEPAVGEVPQKEDAEDKPKGDDGEKKLPAKQEEEDDMPDMPTLNLN